MSNTLKKQQIYQYRYNIKSKVHDNMYLIHKVATNVDKP